MYLIVFVFLMLAIVGLYTEVFALQVSHIMAQQKAIGQIMLVWHGGALAFARANRAALGTGSTTPAGCLLTSGLPLTNPIPCDAPFLNTNTAYLPSGYQANYRWYSVVYVPGGNFGAQQFVLTYAAPVRSC